MCVWCGVVCGVRGGGGESGLGTEVINLRCLHNISVAKSRRQVEV